MIILFLQLMNTNTLLYKISLPVQHCISMKPIWLLSSLISKRFSKTALKISHIKDTCGQTRLSWICTSVKAIFKDLVHLKLFKVCNKSYCPFTSLLCPLLFFNCNEGNQLKDCNNKSMKTIHTKHEIVNVLQHIQSPDLLLVYCYVLLVYLKTNSTSNKQ